MSQNDLSPGWTPLGFLRDLKPKQPQLPPSSTSRNLNPDAAPFMPRPSSSSSLEGSKLMDRVDLIRMLNLHQHQRLIITEDAWNLMIENKWMFQRYPCPLRTAMGRQQQQQQSQSQSLSTSTTNDIWSPSPFSPSRMLTLEQYFILLAKKGEITHIGGGRGGHTNHHHQYDRKMIVIDLNKCRQMIDQLYNEVVKPAVIRDIFLSSPQI